MGVLDQGDFHKPMDASTRSMRHSAAIGGRLWSMLVVERERVRSFVLPFLMRLTNERRLTDWSARLGSESPGFWRSKAGTRGW